MVPHDYILSEDLVPWLDSGEDQAGAQINTRLLKQSILLPIASTQASPRTHHHNRPSRRAATRSLATIALADQLRWALVFLELLLLSFPSSLLFRFWAEPNQTKNQAKPNPNRGILIASSKCDLASAVTRLRGCIPEAYDYVNNLLKPEHS